VIDEDTILVEQVVGCAVFLNDDNDVLDRRNVVGLGFGTQEGSCVRGEQQQTNSCELHIGLPSRNANRFGWVDGCRRCEKNPG